MLGQVKSVAVQRCPLCHRCSHCRQLEPVWQSLAEEMQDHNVHVAKVGCSSDWQPALWHHQQCESGAWTGAPCIAALYCETMGQSML